VACRFKHNDTADLEQKLADLDGSARKLLVVDAVYSMDGDVAPLEALLQLRDRYPNTLLMVDEAHSLGVLGTGGRGIEEHVDCMGQVDVLMGSLSKAVPAQGGYITAAKDLVTYLRGSARGFVFSAALPPMTAAAALAAFELIDRDGVALRSQLVSGVRHLIQQLEEAGFKVGDSSSAIVPILLNSEDAAVELARRCNQYGLYAMPVLSPAVPRGTERLRLSVTCAHRRKDLDMAVSILRRAWREISCMGGKSIGESLSGESGE
jgi:glycine C-acetyltransferase